jgi:DNA-binding GntR family transcriptional regulator
MTAGLEPRGGKAAKAGAAAHSGNGETGPPAADGRGSAAAVLADRMAAALVHREPGWKLPRRSALARRFNVSLAEIDVAVEELSRRALLRKLPDGQLYRASPAEYQIPIEGVAGLSTTVDPMGSVVVCQARHVSRRPAPQDICWALGLAPGTQVRVIRCLWTSGGRPVAMSTAYQPPPPAARQPVTSRVRAPRDDEDSPWLPAFEELLSAPPAEFTDPPAEFTDPPAEFTDPPAEFTDPPADGGPDGPDATTAAGRPAALNVELSPPQPSIARGLHLAPGQSAITVTIRFDESSVPVALTVVMLRPDFFKVSVETAAPGSLPGATAGGAAGPAPRADIPGLWTRTVPYCEPNADAS